MLSFLKNPKNFSYTIDVSERMIQERLDSLLPIEKQRFFISVCLSKPRVELLDMSNEVGIHLHLDVIAPGGLKYGGSGQLRGQIRYEASQGEFFIDTPKVKDLNIDLLPGLLSPLVSNIIELVLAQASARLPVYRLKDNDAKHQFAKLALKKIKVKHKTLRITLGLF